MIIFFLCVLGYLLGSIPFGLVLTRAAGLGDIRSIGSGNIGATNVLRTGNKKLAAATLFLDGFKGYLAVLIAWQFGDLAPYCVGLAVFLGHLYPIWLGFKGGKGVATGLGVLLAESFPVGLIACAAWLGTAVLMRYSSTAALVAFASAPFAAVVLGHFRLAALAMVIAALVYWKHSPNIARLKAGTEPKIGKKA
ncbi:MAG TPA: glycerol-3-phosphate 1-O-acyltransferase PlsY [Acidocella sp.]|nr:glycerol-3-phosphate 1-O-acyltransferase PlsY [Acidocella sp.]HQU04741.1 glycerol-3-phosphate 1-O-acyltransferase PlsY [Acidocella sp.]